MKKLELFIVVIFILLINLRCESRVSDLEKEGISIITMLYNKESSIQIPPPPPPARNIPIKDYEIPKKNVLKEYESQEIIYKKIYAISLVNESITKSEIEMLPSEFKYLFANPQNDFSIEDFAKIHLQDSKGETIPILQEQAGKIADLKEKHKVFGILSYSDIIFNDSLNMAVCRFGAYTHGLSGYTSILAMKKIEDKWVIIVEKNISES